MRNDLPDIFYLYGELKEQPQAGIRPHKSGRQTNYFTIGDFLEIIKPLFGREREKKELAKE